MLSLRDTAIRKLILGGQIGSFWVEIDFFSVLCQFRKNVTL